MYNFNFLFSIVIVSTEQGAPVRDSTGGAVPDRIPCLKVKLLLPNWPGGSSNAGAGAGARNQASPDPTGALKKVILCKSWMYKLVF